VTRLTALLAVGLVAAPSLASIDILVLSPRSNRPVFGAVKVEAQVLSGEPLEELTLHVNGEEVARWTKEPFTAVIDVGYDNVAHVFEFTARDVYGNEAERRVVTEKANYGEELTLQLQQVFVTVTRGGRRVEELTREDFEVSDDGASQKIVTFEGGETPLTAALLLDTSFSMRGEHLTAALAGARVFLDAMRPLDRGKVMLFSDATLASTPFSEDPGSLEGAVGGAEAGAGTAVNDHLYLALLQLQQQAGRRMIVLLSDGVDVESVLDVDDVLWKAGRLPVLVYWIRVDADASKRLSYYSLWRDPATHRRELDGLEELVRRSGGRIVEIRSIEEAPVAFRGILDELRGQYVLGYYPSDNRNDGRWHDVEVKVVRARGQARSSQGYYDVAE
jgi:Ca-activated chloride channel family protein